MEPLPKLIAITGPTSSGKTDLSISLAKHFGGEIVSADSRQIYRGMDIGSGKVTTQEMGDIPHYGLDIATPGDRFTLADYIGYTHPTIESIIHQKKLPFLVGGTPLYIRAVVDNYLLPRIPESIPLRQELEKKTTQELQDLLREKDTIAYEHIDINNPRRIIRALEAIILTNQSITALQKKGPVRYEALILAPLVDRDELYKKIDARVDERIKQGMIQEAAGLLEQGIPYDFLYSMGQEYRFCAEYIKNIRTDREAMITELKFAIHDFARRQLTWFRRDKRIQWVQDEKEARGVIDAFLHPTSKAQ